MQSYDLSVHLAIKAGGDEPLARALELGKLTTTLPSGFNGELALQCSTKLEVECQCSFCGKTIASGLRVFTKKRTSSFTDWKDLKNGENNACSECYIMISSGAKYLRRPKKSITTSEGMVCIEKDFAAYTFWREPPKPPFVVAYYTKNLSHVFWRSTPSFSAELFCFNFDATPYLVSRTNINYVLEQVTTFKNNIQGFYLAQLEQYGVETLAIPSFIVKDLKSDELSTLGGNYKHVRNLADNDLGTLKPWIFYSLQAITALDDIDIVTRNQAINLLDRARHLEALISQLNNGEIWWLYLNLKFAHYDDATYDSESQHHHYRHKLILRE